MLTPAGLVRLKLDEGFRKLVYNDASGQTIFKTNLSPAGWPTIGYGRNLTGKGITEAEATYLLNNDLAECERQVIAAFGSNQCAMEEPVAWDVCIMIAYNTGNFTVWRGLQSAIKQGQYAAQIGAEVRQSAAWENPISKPRYERFAVAITNGTWVGAGDGQ